MCLTSCKHSNGSRRDVVAASLVGLSLCSVFAGAMRDTGRARSSAPHCAGSLDGVFEACCRPFDHRCHVRLSQRPPARYIQRPEAQPRLPVPTHRYWVTTCNESARRGFDNGLQRAVPKATSANFGPERAPRLRLRRGGGGGDLDRFRDLLRVRIGPSRC